MRRLVILSIVVALLVVVADFAAKAYAEARIEEVAEREGGVSTSARADIRSFPFLPGILTSGRAGGVNVHITGLVAGRLPLAAVEIDLGDLRLDKAKLLGGEGVEVTSISDALIAVEVTGPDLASATGLPVRVADGKVGISVGGRTVPVTASVSGEGSLQLRGAAVAPATLGLDQAGLSTCDSTRVEVRDDRLRIECETEEVPRLLVKAAARRGG